MKSKIYVVYKCGGEFDDYKEEPYKAFGNIDKAKECVKTCEYDEEMMKKISEKCTFCDMSDKTCPFYVDPIFKNDGCDMYSPYYYKKTFIIKELDFED